MQRRGGADRPALQFDTRAGFLTRPPGVVQRHQPTAGRSDPGTLEVASQVHQHAAHTASQRRTSRQVGGETFADPAGIQPVTGGDQHRVPTWVDDHGRSGSADQLGRRINSGQRIEVLPSQRPASDPPEWIEPAAGKLPAEQSPLCQSPGAAVRHPVSTSIQPGDLAGIVEPCPERCQSLDISDDLGHGRLTTTVRDDMARGSCMKVPTGRGAPFENAEGSLADSPRQLIRLDWLPHLLTALWFGPWQTSK
jgi:hypothetical protein